MTDAMNPIAYHESDLQISLYAIRKTLQTGIVSPDGAQSPFFEAVITKLLIDLNDALQKSAAGQKRVSFTDDVDQGSTPRDITDLINFCRNAACHISSGSKLFENNKFSFCCMIGLCPNGIVIGDKILGCDFPDDIAVYWGGTRLYLKRNVVRAFNEVSALNPGQF